MMLGVLLISVLLSSHPVHVSISSIEYVPAKGKFDLYIKVWRDDFLTDYRLAEKDFGVNSNSQDLFPDKKHIEQYVGKRLRIAAENRYLTGTVDRIEEGELEVEIYMSYRYKANGEDITVQNSIMTELYDDQANMLIFKFKEKEEGVKFSGTYIEKVFQLK